MQLSFRLSYAWQCQTLLRNYISQVCLCLTDYLNRWVSYAANCHKKLQHLVFFISLDHCNHCLSFSSCDDMTDDVREYASGTGSAEFVKLISLQVRQPNGTRRKFRAVSFTHVDLAKQLTGAEGRYVNNVIFRVWCGSFLFMIVPWVLQNGRQKNYSGKMSKMLPRISV